MFKKRIIDTTDELDNDYYRSPILYDPFKTTTPSAKKSLINGSNKKTHSVIFEDNNDFDAKDDFGGKYNDLFCAEDIRETPKPVWNKSNEHLHHPLEQPIRFLSDSLIQF